MTKRPPWALVAVVTLVGFLLVVTGNATSVASKAEEPRKKELINQILQKRSNVDDLDQAVAQLRAQVEQAQTVAGRASEQQQNQNDHLQSLAMDAGTEAVKGSGIVVKLSDAPEGSGERSSNFDANRIQDSDIQLVVNALFASGADAVSINDNRVSAVTPIRAAGGTIVVNYRPVNSPYRISAIGADKRQFESTEIARHFEQWKKKFNLGYSVEKDGSITVPAYSGRVSIDQAQAVTQQAK